MPSLSRPLVVLLLIAGGAVAHGAYRWWTVARGRAEADRAAQRLRDAAPGSGDAWIWRAIPTECAEPLLVVGYERECRHRVLQYPLVQPARHVRFADGRVHLMTESALERTLEADDALRDKLGLQPADEA